MSLINQALHKAQRDRTPNRIAEPGSSTRPHAGPAPSSGMKPGLVIGLIAVVAVLLGLVLGLSLVLFKGSDSMPTVEQAPTAPTPASVEQASSTPPAETAAAPTAKAPAVPTALEPITPAIATESVDAPLERVTTSPPLIDELRKARVAAEAKADAEAKVAAEAAAQVAAKPSQEIIDWLSSSHVSGVKISSTESKVILNGESYAVGEYVNYSLGVKLMVVQENRILFVDENGKKYMKRL